MNKSLIIGFLFFSHCLTAQVTDTIKDLPAEQLEVIKQFQARLEDARKIDLSPEPPAQRVLKEFDYAVSIKPLELQYLEPNIKPLGIAREELPKKYNSFVQVGAGNLNTLDADLGLNYLTARDTEVNLTADYLTQENKKERFQKYSHLNTDLTINHQFNELVSFSAFGGYHQKNVGFYGSPTPSFDVLDTSIYFRTLADYGFGFKVFNAAENEFDVDYQLGMKYNNFSLRDENLVENNFLIDLNLRKGINENFDLMLDGIADISSILDTATYSYNNYHIKPGIAYHGEKLGIDAALDFAFGPDSQSYFLPDLELRYAPTNYALIPYVFWKSELQKNNMNPLFAYNPFLSTAISSTVMNSVVTRYGLGARGQIKGLQYDANIGYGDTEDLVFFRNTIGIDRLRQFVVLQSDRQVLEVNVAAEYMVSAMLDVELNFNYNYYDMVVLHLPAYQFDIRARYSMLDEKLTLAPSLFIRDGVTVFEDETNAVIDLPYMLDLNMHASYKIANQFSVFGEVNNILASEYQQWYDYSNFGLNAKAGLKIKF